MNVINKVVYDDRVLIDLTADTVDPDRMYKGDTAHAADGTEITGTAEITVEGTRLIMPEGLCTLLGTVDPETHHWVRPDYLPDIQSVYNGEENTLFMVVDATGRISDPHVSIKFWTTGSKYTVQVGSIQNGAFVAQTTEEVANQGIWTKVWTPAAGLYPVIKVSANVLRNFQLQAWTSSDSHIYAAQYQPIVAWIGHMNYSDTYTRTPFFTEYEKINVDTCNANFLQYRWYQALSLQELDVSEWDTSGWAINSLYQTWYQCINLPYLDVSGWDTSNWAVTTMAGTWDNCFSLTGIDARNWNTSKWKVISINSLCSQCSNLEYFLADTWNTSNWAVTAMQYTWYYNFKLKALDLPWDTSNWKVVTFSATWYLCRALEILDISSWNTSQWAVTSMSSTWEQCFSLKELDLSGWDTSNWAVTSMVSTWRYCYDLEHLAIENWDTSNWHVTTIATTWDCCYKLKSLDLSGWDVSNWVPTTCNQTWGNCYELEYLDCSTWDVSDWPINSYMNTWVNCRRLRVLKIEAWNVSKWKITAIQSIFNNCVCLEELPVANWDVSGWRPTNMTSAFNWCMSLKKFQLNWNTSGWSSFAAATAAYCFANLRLVREIDLSWIDLSKIPDWRSGGGTCFDTCRFLTHITFGENNRGKLTITNATYNSIRFDWSVLLTHDSLLNIIDVLADGVSGKTLQLGSANLNKLTAAEKAIATNKGWTLA